MTSPAGADRALAGCRHIPVAVRLLTSGTILKLVLPAQL
jgi:hypothetical protein